MNLTKWAIDWGVSAAALQDLRIRMGIEETQPKQPTGMSEAAVQARVRLEASQKGLRLWRNNVGALEDLRGNMVRYGLANDSAAMNRVIKSADLVGIRPLRIEPYHVGTIIGQFVSREVKAKDWNYTGTKHEEAQLRWLELIISLGGDAAFCNDVGTL